MSRPHDTRNGTSHKTSALPIYANSIARFMLYKQVLDARAAFERSIFTKEFDMTNNPGTSTLVAIRAAHHPETSPPYDRVVFEFNGPVPLVNIEYVDELLGDGSGLLVSIAGTAIVRLIAQPAQAHTEQGQPTAPTRVAYNLPIVKEVVGAGDFEGQVTYGIGLATKATTRVITLQAKSRIVIDLFPTK
jgi:hypothetical protein